jgi:Sec-independent protein secretion pathway component TatC
MVWTTVALSVPLYLLYELSVLAASIIYRKKKSRAAALTSEHEGLTA